MQGVQLDSNNIGQMYSSLKKIAQNVREKQRPILIECKTFRTRAHEESSSIKHIHKSLIQEWKQKDPLLQLEKHLLENQLILQPEIDAIKATFKNKIDTSFKQALQAEPATAKTTNLNIFAPFKTKPKKPNNSLSSNLRFIDAITDAHFLAMRRFHNLILIGQDIGEHGGVFKVSQGLIEEFGEERIRDTPICESTVIGASLGLSINGYKSIIEMQFADFISCAFSQLVNNLAKSYFRTGVNADVVIRMPTGASIKAGPFHSQSNEATFFHIPGLKIVYPSSPYDAKGLLLSSIEDPNPVLFFEHKALYRKIKQNIPTSYYTIEIGKAKFLQEGKDISIITYGLGVIWAEEILTELPNISANILDLRTLMPLDKESIKTCLQKAPKVLILHEDNLSGGIAAEISALICENFFEYLDAPIIRCASMDTPIPFAQDLEEHYLAKRKLKDKIQALINY
jgi:2-oxoisovalerate dehydrogenase E1 component